MKLIGIEAKKFIRNNSGTLVAGSNPVAPTQSNPSHTSESLNSLFYFSFVLKSLRAREGEDLYSFG